MHRARWPAAIRHLLNAPDRVTSYIGMASVLSFREQFPDVFLVARLESPRPHRHLVRGPVMRDSGEERISVPLARREDASVQ